jgi:hypothetical protein
MNQDFMIFKLRDFRYIMNVKTGLEESWRHALEDEGLKEKEKSSHKSNLHGDQTERTRARPGIF